MTVERSSYISLLDDQYPEAFDLLKEGDDHIRLIKENLRNTLPKFDRKVEFSAEQLNKLYTWLMAIEDTGDDPEALNRFTVLDDAEMRKDLYFTEGGEDGTDSSTPDTPKISGLSEIQFTTEETNDPKLITDEKLSRALTLGTAEKRYAKLNDFDALDNSKLTVTVGDEVKTIAIATDGLLTVNDKLKTVDIEAENFKVLETLVALKDIEISGDLRVTGKIFRGSDKRIKEDIKTLPEVVNLDRVWPVQYKKQGKLEFGVIAQELPKTFEHLIDEGEDGLLSVDYTQFIPVLIKEIQELKKEIKILKSKG